MRRYATIIIATVLIAVLAPMATADWLGTVDVQHTGVSPSRTLALWGQGFMNGINVYTGMYHHNLANIAPNPADPRMQYMQDWGFCIEFNYSSGAWLQYDIMTVEQAPDIGGPMGQAKADYLRELWAEHIDDVHNGGADQAAAFQAAVWEIVYEDAQAWDAGAWAGTADSFRMTGNATVTNLANTWLADAADVGGPLFGDLVAVSRVGAQDYLVQIPAPGASLLGIIGVGVIAALRRRVS